MTSKYEKAFVEYKRKNWEFNNKMEKENCVMCQGYGLLQSDEECMCVENKCSCKNCKC